MHPAGKIKKRRDKGGTFVTSLYEFYQLNSTVLGNSEPLRISKMHTVS